jgi:hypothetical protein
MKQDLVDDKTALDAKIETLRAYCGGPAYRTIERDEQHLLVRQLQLMTAYSEILGERIAAIVATEMTP